MNARMLLDESFAAWTPEDRNLIAAIALDWTHLQARQLTGADVNVELAHVTAQIASVQAAGGLSASQAFAGWLHRVANVGATLLGALL